MKLTITQLDSETPTALKDQWQALCAHTNTVQPDLVLLPEMPFYRWLPATQRFNPYHWRDAITVHTQWLARLHELNAAAVALTIPTWHDDGLRHNVGVLWQATSGAKAIHAKAYLPEEAGVWEQSWYAPGEREFQAVDYDGVRLGFSICSEIWFLNVAAHYLEQGTHLLLSPRATEGPTLEKWRAAGITNAVVAGAFNASSNRSGTTSNGDTFGGAGWLISPDGDILGQTSTDTPFVTLDIDLSHTDTQRKRYPRYISR